MAVQVGLVGGFDLAAGDHREYGKAEVWISLAVPRVPKYDQPERPCILEVSRHGIDLFIHEESGPDIHYRIQLTHDQTPMTTPMTTPMAT